MRLHFAGQGDLVLLAVRAADLGPGCAGSRRAGGQLFPHHYGALTIGVVAGSATIAVGADGSVALPGWVR